MKLHAKLAIGLTAIGITVMVGLRVVEPIIADALQADVSDVGEKGTIKIGVDAWVGYFPLCSPEMKKNLNREGYGLRCTDDAADYQDRFKRLKSSDYDFVVATVDSYLLNGEQYNFPGPIVAVLDESKGGDAIIGRRSVVPNLEALKKAKDIGVAYTPDSPSHHLIKAVASHFDVELFRNKRNLIKANGSEAALEKLLDGQVDIAVVWEPEVSKSLENKQFVRLLGTEDTQQLIVDILIASQSVVKKDSDMLRSLMRAYFKTLKYYRDHQDKFIKEIARHYDIKKGTAKDLLGGVHWVTLSDNAEHWYGVDTLGFSDEALIHTIESAADILMENGDFSRNPIPYDDPYRLINSTFIKDMYERFANAGGFTRAGNDKPEKNLIFNSLLAAQWDALQPIASLKARQIKFSSGTSDLTLAGKEQIDQLVADLKHYPNFRVEVRGHSGIKGDIHANLALSQQRADSVVRYIDVAHSLDENRIRAVGFGGEKPLAKRPGETNRAYHYRLPRVEIVLVREIL